MDGQRGFQDDLAHDAIASGDLVLCDDNLVRPIWAAKEPLLRNYYDHEWGVPIYTESGVLERICLEGFQSGLSWATILRKRRAFREAFSGFNADVVADYTDGDVERLVANEHIIRHRGKIRAAIANARATIALRDEGGLAAHVWSFQPKRTPCPRYLREIPTQSPESVALSKDLHRRGFRFVGPTTMFALMEAIGMVDTHLLGSPRRGTSGLFDKDGYRLSPRD
ncbi:DNA-3-methyladenine glycosylase I [Devriesea agamarum]|uniref:DNA-3-methyladenine glycosylase I n=1 Tax=Devriesea agamarum TaxID=472569 RepID=UPI00071C84E3|nr:DNA-3-methyladenine glycosylase I [Devriesea agamarum]